MDKKNARVKKALQDTLITIPSQVWLYSN